MQDKHERLRDAIEAGKPVSALYCGYWVKLLPQEIEWRQEEAYLLATRLLPSNQGPADVPDQTPGCERFPVALLQCLVTSPERRPAATLQSAGLA